MLGGVVLQNPGEPPKIHLGLDLEASFFIIIIFLYK